MDTADEFPAGHMGAAARIKKCEDRLRPTTRELCTRVSDGGIFGNLLRAVTVISVQQICYLNITLN
jgi:hypothetical protein